MAMLCPFMLSLPGLQSQSTAFATSAGCTRRCCGLKMTSDLARLGLAARGLLADGADRVAHDAGVRVAGQTALTVMPVFATSSASARVKPTRPCFAAQ